MDALVTEDPKRRLEAAQHRLAQLGGSSNEAWRSAFEELHSAERALAAAEGGQYAVEVEDGPVWSTGAPLPHVITNRSSVYIVCLANTRAASEMALT